MQLTNEQISILNSNSNKILIEALAGTGKTFILMKYAEKYFTNSVLYIVFNKDMRKSSKTKFPANTVVHTINSFSYKYNKDFIKGKMIIDNFNSTHIIDNLKFLYEKRKINPLEAIKEANLILLRFYSLMNSNINLEDIEGDKYTDFAKDFYHSMIEKGILDHSSLLKHFHDNFNFSELDYDIVMLDEAQDLNPIMLSIIEKINPEKILIVGDSNQSIYSFRQNINIFKSEKVKNFNKFYLTKSFRFGKEIANSIQDFYSNILNKKFSLGFNENIQSYVTDSELLGNYSVYITRTNANLFDKALEYALLGYKVSIPFDWEDLKSSLTDMYYLKVGLLDSINNKQIKQYLTFDNIKNLNKDGNDLELSYLIKVVDKHDFLILDYLKILERQLSASKYADITFITAHKSKGLEFLNVTVSNDFSLYSLEERNLIYVAMTRAIQRLNISELKLKFNLK